MRLEFKDDKFIKLIQNLKIKGPVLMQEMADNALANTASEGRLKEQAIAHSLELGKWHETTRNGKRMGLRTLEGTFLRQSRQGWVSTRYITSTGPFRMASFGWELARPNTRKVGYTSQLANLWANPTKPYSKSSPPFKGPRGEGRWGKNAVRPSMYEWDTVYSKMKESVSDAIVKTERSARTQGLLKEIEKI